MCQLPDIEVMKMRKIKCVECLSVNAYSRTSKVVVCWSCGKALVIQSDLDAFQS